MFENVQVKYKNRLKELREEKRENPLSFFDNLKAKGWEFPKETIQSLRSKLERGRHLSQPDMAELLGCDPTTYLAYENGKRDTPTSVLLLLADAYDVSVDYLLGRAQYRNVGDKELQEILGLSPESIMTLKKAQKNNLRMIDGLNWLLGSVYDMSGLFDAIKEYLTYPVLRDKVKIKEILLDSERSIPFDCVSTFIDEEFDFQNNTMGRILGELSNNLMITDRIVTSNKSIAKYLRCASYDLDDVTNQILVMMDDKSPMKRLIEGRMYHWIVEYLREAMVINDEEAIERLLLAIKNGHTKEEFWIEESLEGAFWRAWTMFLRNYPDELILKCLEGK